ncbi:hypothetical protein [Thiomonas sp.]|jgi:DNA-binding NtrC family response regulator|uniref:hypothetical protein n=1 Tax=Thiomonas sp. TaxID=2047785 RepID=UPI0026035AD1|nr:hypothetical protein [Thiomonas sp.]
MSAAEAQAARRGTVLVVGAVHADLVAVLQRLAHRVDGLQDPQQPPPLRGRRAPDVLVVDLFIPGTDGLTLLRRWATGAHGPLPPSIVLAPPGPVDGQALRRLRIDSWLVKPVQPQELATRVRRLLAAADVADAAPAVQPADAACLARAAACRTPAEALAAIDLQQPLRRAREEFMRAYLRRQIDRAQGCVREAARAAEMDYSAFYRQIRKLGLQAILTRSDRRLAERSAGRSGRRAQPV